MSEPTREEVDAWAGLVVLEFGTPTCAYCLAARPLIERMLAARPDVEHLKITDAPGAPLGRSFHVRLWPTLVMLRDGVEVARVVRPHSELALGRALDALSAAAAGTPSR